MVPQNSPLAYGLPTKSDSEMRSSLPQHWQLASNLARQGIKVIPCLNGTVLTPNGVNQATDDVTLITTWGTKMYPWADVAIATGAAMEVSAVVVDLDNEGHVMWEHLLNKHGDFPRTWHYRLDNKFIYLVKNDKHFYSTNLVAGKFHGISVKAQNDFIVAFPRKGNCQFQFYFFQDDFQIAQTPEWLYRYIPGTWRNGKSNARDYGFHI